MASRVPGVVLTLLYYFQLTLSPYLLRVPNFIRPCCSGIRDSLSLDVILSRTISLLLSLSLSLSSYCYICVCDSVLILLYMCPHTAMCVLILHSYIRKPCWKDDGKKGRGVMGGMTSFLYIPLTLALSAIMKQHKTTMNVINQR